MNVLIIENCTTTARSLELMLEAEGMRPTLADYSEEGIDLARRYDFEVILASNHLPDMSGEVVVRHLRAGKIETPAIIISADDRAETQITSLEAGADDFITKPFDRRELVARIRAITRRMRGYASPVITVGALEIDTTNKTLHAAGKRVSLSVKEFEIIELLAMRQGATVTKPAFMEYLYAGRDEPEEKIIDVFVCKLRKKLAQATGGESYIETVWGRGYAMRAPQAQPIAAE